MAIASRSLQCLRHLEHLAEEAQHSDGESALPASAVGDELGRFKIWAGNIGALQRDSRSLDYRLRDASQVGDQVMKVLQDLELSLHECIEIVSGQRAQKQGDLFDGEAFNDEFSDISDSDGSEDPSSSASEEEPVSELSHLFLAITEAITSLYKLSITIRNPTPRDRYAKAASSTPFDASYDVGHVYEKFPHVRSKAWLMDKLGRAITRRREFLRYREKHREKIGGNVRPSTDLTEHHELAISRKNLTYNDAQTSTGAPVIGYEAHSVSHSQFASTKATTYVANLNDESLDMRSTAGRSETSYVTSVAEDNSENTMQIPDPPKESANGMPFECPYCFTIQSVRNAKHWRKHLLSDLKPYICTFEDCSAQMFDRRHMWFQHEMDKHRKQWRCRFCSCELFGSAASLESHLQDQHSEYTKQQVLSLVALCAQMPEHVAASACPFCDWDADLREQAVSKENETARAPSESNIFAVSLEQFQRHLGDHLEQLALFAIPPPMKELSGASSNQAAASHNSNHTLDSFVVSEVSSLSSALTDNGFPPELYAAVMSGNIGRVTLELRNRADLTLQYGGFGNVLHAAAASLSWPSRDEILRILVENGADANMQGGVYGNTLQAVAADPSMSGRRLLALGMLLDHGAEVNAVGGRYGHALIAAAAMPTPLSQMQHEPTSMVLKLLLDHGANPNARGSKSYGSALHQAIEHDDYESVQLLLDRGASTTVHYEDYGTPVHYAMKHAYGPVWQLLRQAALETRIERHYDKVPLRAALKIQRYFRHRQNSGDRTPRSTVGVRFSNEVGITTFSGVEQPSTLYYGVPLEELCQREKGPVPKLITDCIEAVEFHGMGLIGVYGNFHIDWNENLTDDLKAEYDQHPESLSLQQQIRIPNNIEYVTHLLKNFIWQLPGLLIPRESLARFVRAAQFVARQRIDHFGYEKGEGQATTELQATISSLPQVNRNVFEFLILHFKRVTDRAYQNTMTSDKLAVALAPSFKGGVDSGAGPKLPLADLSWALEYIIRRGGFWFRDLEKPWGVFE